MKRTSNFPSISEQNLLRTMFLGSRLSSGGAASGQTLCQIASEHPKMCTIFRLRRANMGRTSSSGVSCFFNHKSLNKISS